MKPGPWIRRAWRRLGPRGRWLLLTVLLCLVGLGGGLAWGSWTHVCDDCPSIAQIYAFQPKEATRVFAADGSLLAELAVERRTAVPYRSLPWYVPEAFVAIEDKRFWHHHGVDLIRTFRAGIEFLIHGYDVAGGSTITQQLAGNMFPSSVNRQRVSIRRKLKEMHVALDLESAYTKREILQAYLNQINFGRGHYGVQSAARWLFGVDARDLNLPQAALLAALPKAPERYSPIDHPDRALVRRNLVLQQMADQGIIDRETAEAGKAYPLSLHRKTEEEGSAPYFVEWVRQKLMDRYGPEIYSAGLRVYTTLDPGLQQVADSALHAQLKWVEEQRGFPGPTYEATRSWPEGKLAGSETPYVQGLFIALDPRTGNVLSLIGGRDFDDSEFDRATQALRQPGSVFKPFVYTAAIASGIPASELFYDTPVEIVLPDSSIYSPKDFGGQFLGPLTLREALYRSINVVAVKVGQKVGEEAIAQYAHSMGITTDVPRVPSVAIGAASVIPLEIAQAYTTFANEGVRATPRAILQVEDSDGNVLWRSRVQKEDVLDRRVAYIMLTILRDVVDAPHGTGVAVRRDGVPDSVPVAGKTGTTNDATDAWFVGFTPDIVTTSWVGFDRPQHLHFNAQGGLDAAPINAAVLRWYYENHPVPAPWPEPDGLVHDSVDESTGMLATQWCPPDSVYREIFLPGTEPRPCDVHGPFSSVRRSDSLGLDSLDLPD